MKFKSIEITPIGHDWTVKYSILPDEILNVKAVPSSLGFYHYHEAIEDKQAFGMLKDAMVFAITKYINELKISLDKLKILDYKEAEIE